MTTINWNLIPQLDEEYPIQQVPGRRLPPDYLTALSILSSVENATQFKVWFSPSKEGNYDLCLEYENEHEDYLAGTVQLNCPPQAFGFYITQFIRKVYVKLGKITE